jgi:hypothetical protein
MANPFGGLRCANPPYSDWPCPRFSVVETINQLMRRTIGRQNLWDRHALPEKNADGSPQQKSTAIFGTAR